MIAAELAARFGLGLGDPPISMQDPEIEYMFVPSRCYDRFDNRVCYNRWSMRSGEFPRDKAQCERRIMVLGDSIVNGGALIDQEQIATELAREELGRAESRTIVGNISAGSWGPVNLLAYTRRFGWFDADAAVFVFSSSDLEDLPDFASDLGPDMPTRRPWLALEEVLTRYLPRYVEKMGPAPSSPPLTPDPSRRANGVAGLEALLEEASQHVGMRVVLFHFQRSELGREPPEQEALVRTLSDRAGARFMSLRDRESASLYSDDIHLNVEGQAVLARVLVDVVQHVPASCPSKAR